MGVRLQNFFNLRPLNTTKKPETQIPLFSETPCILVYHQKYNNLDLERDGSVSAVTGPALYEIAAHGSTSKVPFCTMGSGTLAAMSVLESQ